MGSVVLYNIAHMAIKVLGTGSYLPPKVVTNEDIAAVLDTSDEWIFSHTGIRARHVAEDGETTSTMAAKAAKAPAKDAKVPAKGEKPAAEVKAKQEPKAEPPPQIVITMNELWERAYGCLASAVRIRHAVRQIVKKGAEADAYSAADRASMEKLAELSRVLVDMLDQVKASKDVENVRKGITFIKSKGESTVASTEKRLRIEKLEAERKAKAEGK